MRKVIARLRCNDKTTNLKIDERNEIINVLSTIKEFMKYISKYVFQRLSYKDGAKYKTNFFERYCAKLNKKGFAK